MTPPEWLECPLSQGLLSQKPSTSHILQANLGFLLFSSSSSPLKNKVFSSRSSRETLLLFSTRHWTRALCLLGNCSSIELHPQLTMNSSMMLIQEGIVPAGSAGEGHATLEATLLPTRGLGGVRVAPERNGSVRAGDRARSSDSSGYTKGQSLQGWCSLRVETHFPPLCWVEVVLPFWQMENAMRLVWRETGGMRVAHPRKGERSGP